MESETRDHSASLGGSTSHWAFPLKATLSPAEVFDHPVESIDAIPRDYSHTQSGPSTRTASSGAMSATSAQSSAAMTTNDELNSLTAHRRLSRVSEMLHKKIESPPQTPRALSNFKIAESPYSSTDSLASLVERQQKNKIINPLHQASLFCKDKRPSSIQAAVDANDRRSSAASLMAVLQGQRAKRVSDSIPNIKSPLHLEATPSQVASRRLHPHLNPYHVHSSPSVKESTTVSLGYDPVSRKKMLNSYEIIKEIGRGEHGKVKLAKDVETEELFAIKIVDRKGRRRSLRPGSSHEEKIRREIAIMKKINHPNVVQLVEVMDDINSRKIYLVLEYLEKGEVKWQKSKDVPMMPLKESMMVFRDILLGLEYLHYQGIIHRDIKPANLLIAGDGSVKISDFGVSFASSLKTGEQDDYDLAKTAGTPAFLAPELCRPLDEDEKSHPKITYKIDIWALGVTLYCFIFGKLPFWATNEFELFDVICSKELEFPEAICQSLSKEDLDNVVDLLTKILDKDPKRRLTIKEIKSHPLTIRDLLTEEADLFTQKQKSCESKINVSKEEVQVAVTGLGSKLRKGFAKALKFAGLAGSSSKKTNTADKETDQELLGHRRVKSDDVSSETYANVEGDLFLNTSSAFNSLNNIFNDDKRRSSASLNMTGRSTGPSSTAVSDSISNDSSISRIPTTQMVSLPVNASFASLDSVYMDNYAQSYAYTNVVDARGPPPGRNVFSNYEMNKSTSKKSDDAVAPTFCWNDSESDSDSEEDDDNEREDDYDDNDDENDDDDDILSEISVPSYLVQDIGGNGPAPAEKTERQSPTIPTRGAKPKYSFFESSDDDSDSAEHSGPEVVFAESSDDEEPITAKVNRYLLQRHRSADASITTSQEDEEEEDSSDGELTLSFGGNRPRTLSTEVLKKPERVSSPLSHNAPKTPIASSNAHSKPHPLSHEQYTNHYHKVKPQAVYHHRDHVNSRVRSNSITVGLLKSPSLEDHLY